MGESSTIDRPNIKQLAISKIPLLDALSSPDKARLLDLLLLKEFKKGSSIIVSSEEGRDIMFVADGAVDVKRIGGDGKEVILSRLGVGEFFGEIAFLTNAVRSADVVAVEDAMVLVLRAADFEQMLQSNPGFARALLVDLAHRVAAASTRISDLALLDVYCRVHRVLVQLGKAGKQGASGEYVLAERPTHKDLAAMVGSSREMVTRALSKLESEGVITSDAKKIRIQAQV
jgi:CRP/FNR family cyclic AMP-dependent transcriptional regulator